MTRKTNRFLSLVSLFLLLAVTAAGLISCGKTEAETEKTVTVTIEITDDKGEKTSADYKAKEGATLADVLKDNNLVEGENSEYGFYITAVNGITADYNVDQSYWALYKNGEYMMTGADGETLESGAVYGLVYTKG